MITSIISGKSCNLILITASGDCRWCPCPVEDLILFLQSANLIPANKTVLSETDRPLRNQGYCKDKQDHLETLLPLLRVCIWFCVL